MTQAKAYDNPTTASPLLGATDDRGKSPLTDGLARHRSLLVMINESARSRDLAGALRRAGIDVVGQTTTAEAALALSVDRHPDTLLVHVGGSDTALAEFPAGRQGLPLVILADSADPALVSRAVAAGAMGYVVAPFTPERLLPTLELAAARTIDAAKLRDKVTDISDRLNTRKVVERAKGLLMAHEKLSEQDAFRFIQRTAMDRRSSMRDVANAITIKIAGAA